VVDVSQLAADPAAGTPHMRRHWVSEQVFERADVGAVHLRAAVFFENLAVLVDAGGGRELALPLGSPETVLPLIAGEDVARVATGLLTGPSGAVDPVCLLTGEVMTIGEVVRTFGDGLVYVDEDPAEWRRKAAALYGDATSVEHLSHLWELFRVIGSGHDLYQVTETIERIGGRPPRTLREFARSRSRTG
jgi:uncharacterized protein YbjT (DUF2867 family)